MTGPRKRATPLFVETKWGKWDAKQLGVLKRGYDQAVEAGQDRFSISGETVLTSFAKYMIEFLEGEGLIAI